MTTKPYKLLDSWRGIAALGVVLHHVSSMAIGRNAQLSQFPLYWGLQFGYVGVQLFFVISGYCIAAAAMSSLRKKNALKSFVEARCRRVFPAFWISTIFIVGLSLLMSYLVTSGHLHSSAMAERDLLHRSPLYFVANFTLTNMIFQQPFMSVVCWTLSYELAFYLIVTVLMIPSVNKGSTTNLFTGANLLTSIVMLWLIIAPDRRMYPFDLWPQFGLGILVYQWLQVSKERYLYAWTAVIAALFVTFISLRSLPMSVMVEPSRLTFGVALVFAAVLIALYDYDSRLHATYLGRQLAGLGLFSYSLYLTHFTVLGVVSQVSRVCKVPTSAHLLVSSVGVVAAIAAAYGFYALFERPFLSKRPRTSGSIQPERINPALAVALSAEVTE